MPAIDSLDVAFVSAQVGIANAVSMTKSKMENGTASSCYRLTISTSDGSCHSVIAKCPSESPQTRQIMRGAHMYEREVSFYSYFASSIPIRTPKCYFAQRDEDDTFLLLLEDLSPSAVVDQFASISLEVAKAGLRALAGLHGYTFTKSDILQSPLLHLGGEEEKIREFELVSTLFDLFPDRMGNQTDEPTLRTVMSIKEHFHLLRKFSPTKPCLIHRDFRTDNLLIDACDGKVPLATVDWQLLTVGSPMYDVAYFLVTSLTKEDCEKYENDLIEFYIECLRDYGVEYPREIARHEFAISTLGPVVTSVVAAVTVELNERTTRLFHMMIEKGVAAITRWDALVELKRKS